MDRWFASKLLGAPSGLLKLSPGAVCESLQDEKVQRAGEEVEAQRFEIEQSHL